MVEEGTAMGQIICRSMYVDNELNRVLEGVERARPGNPGEVLHEVAHWWGEMTMVRAQL